MTSRPDESPRSFLHEQVKFWLHRFGYAFVEGPSGNDFRLEVVHRSGQRYRAQLLLYPREMVVTLYIFMTDSGYLPGRMRFVRELAHHLTQQVVFGAFLFADDETGAVVFRDAEHVTEPSAIPRLLHRSAFPISLFQAGFTAINRPKATGKAAAKLAAMMTDTEDGHGISSTLMQQLMMVHEGSNEQASRSRASLSLIVNDDEARPRKSTPLRDY